MKNSLSCYELRVLNKSWNDRLLALTKESPVQAGELSILFDRSPDIFAISNLTSYKTRCLGLFRNEQLLGFVMVSYQKRYIAGEVVDVLYLGNMHVVEKGLGKEMIRHLSKRFHQIIPQNTAVKFLYAYVMENNTAAIKLSEKGFLSARVIGQIEMNILFTLFPVRLNKKYKVRRATAEDINEIVTLLQNDFQKRFLSPVITKETFSQMVTQRPQFDIGNYLVALSDEEVVGVCSVWDMTPLKKNVILSLDNMLRVIRWGYNNAACVLGVSPLPGEGEALKEITVADYAVRNNNPQILQALIKYVFATYRKRGYHAVIVGSSADDRVSKAFRPFLQIPYKYKSREIRVVRITTSHSVAGL